MNKKVLVITLALIVALAGSALAEVKFGGQFTATLKQDSFRVLKDKYELTPGVGFTLSGSSSDVQKITKVVETEEVDEETGETLVIIETVVEEIPNWTFSATLNSAQRAADSLLKLHQYKLELHDEYFKAWIWGRGQVLTAKATELGFITASNGRGENADRARIAVPVVDLATVTLDFSSAGNRLLAFVDGEVAGYDLGLAYARTGWDSAATTNDVIVGYAGGTVGTGDLALDLSADAGVTLGDDLGIAAGLAVETEVTEELELDASVKFRNEHWAAGHGFGKTVDGKQAVVLGAGATYEEIALQVKGNVTQTLVTNANANEVTLGAKYRLSDSVGYDNLFNTNPAAGKTFYNLDAPAVGVSAKVVDFGLNLGTNVRVDVASPVVDGLVWAKAYGEYGKYDYKDEVDNVDNKEANSYKVGADVHVQATPKLVVKPFAYFEGIGKVLKVGSTASYKVGASDTTLGFEVKKVMAEDIRKSEREELLKASITVPF